MQFGQILLLFILTILYKVVLRPELRTLLAFKLKGTLNTYILSSDNHCK